MKKHKKSILLAIKKTAVMVFSMLILLGVYSQSKASDSIQHRKLPIIIKFGNQVIGLPYQNLFKDFNSSGSLGT